MEGVVEQYNRELAEWERKVKENSRPGKKERYAPPERKSVRDTLRRLQAEGKQHRTRKSPTKEKDSFDHSTAGSPAVFT